MKEKIKTLQIIHLALCIGVIVAYVILNVLNPVTEIFNLSEITNEDYLYITIPIIAFVLSNLVYKTLLKNTAKNADEDFNISIFQSASIAR